MIEKEGLEPIISEKTKILILGTAPGNKSDKERKYYQNPTNKMWEILTSALGIKITKDNYEEILLETPIGLWDVYENFKRDKSDADKDTEFIEVNNFDRIFGNKNYFLKYIVFNGSVSFNEFYYRYKDKIKEMGIKVFVLTSTSRRNRIGVFENSSEGKIKLWIDLLSLLLTQK